VETPSARTGRSRRCPCLSLMPRPFCQGRLRIAPVAPVEN
jgi:hypothetical protein